MTVSNRGETSKEICVDASLWARWLTREEGTDEAKKLILLWSEEFDFFVAPSFVIFEVASALTKKYKQGQLTRAQVEEGMKRFYRMPILLYQSADFLAETWSWLQKMGETVPYDVSYLALAAWKKVPFYTADAKFYEKARSFYPDCHLV